MRLLVADDSAVLRAQLVDILQVAGYEVVVAEDGERAWQLLRSGQFKLAVLDWLMPGVDGVEICRRLASNPQLRGIYALLVTGKSRPEEMAQALEAGAADYITKPFSPIELRARVRAGARIVELQSSLSQARKLESIAQLAAGLAHEVNTPIQYIGDNLHFLREAWDAAERRRTQCEALSATASLPPDPEGDFYRSEAPAALDQMVEGVARISQIVQAMKDFANPSAAAIVPIDLHRIVENTIAAARGQWERVAKVVTSFAADLPLVPCAAAEISQALLNLVVNSAQAVEKNAAQGKSGVIAIRTRRVDDQAEIQIADNGCGIAEHLASRVFDPFFTSRPVGKGTGQGLAIAHTIVVEKHGGSLRFESVEGAGTTFFLRLPLPVLPGTVVAAPLLPPFLCPAPLLHQDRADDARLELPT